MSKKNLSGGYTSEEEIKEIQKCRNAIADFVLSLLDLRNNNILLESLMQATAMLFVQGKVSEKDTLLCFHKLYNYYNEYFKNGGESLSEEQLKALIAKLSKPYIDN